jgi:GNAT superfamily N-acetyltransferase
MEKNILDEKISFRLITKDDPIERVNYILRMSYAPLASAGMKYAASHEDVEATKRNIEKGECHLVLIKNMIIGCVNLRRPGAELGPAWYSQSGIVTFGRFAVLPQFQGQGIGGKLLDYTEARAQELGAKEIAFDTSEKALHLIKMYEKRW